MSVPTLEFALAYAEAGYFVLPLHSVAEAAPPEVVERWRSGSLSKKAAVVSARCTCGTAGCPSPGKHPRVARGANDATQDPETIRAWWAQWPDANVGLRLPPGRVALDFDLYEAGAAERLAEVGPQAQTARQQTGGGVHLVYTAPPGSVYASTLDGRTGVDIIHAGHRYIVAEPSNHWTGGRYEWETPPDDVADIPPAVLARCARGVRAAPTPAPPGTNKYANVRLPSAGAEHCPPGVEPERWAQYLAATLPPAIAADEPGSTEHGHVTLARAACHLVAGLGLDVATATETLWEVYNPRCVPPWGEDEFDDFERTVRGAGRDATPGYLLSASGAPPSPVEVAAQAAPLEDPLATLGEGLDWTAAPEAPHWLCKDLGIESGGKTTPVVGYPGAGKGPFTNLFAISVATGRPFLGKYSVVQGPVLVLDWETGKRLSKRRIWRMCRALDIDPAELSQRMHFVNVYRSVDADFYAALFQAVQRLGIKLIVVDSYTSALMGQDVESNASAYAEFLTRLGDFSRQFDLVVMPVMHARKSERGKPRRPRLEDISGTGALAAMAQTVLMLWHPNEDKPSEVDVSCARSTEDPFKPFCMRWADVPAPERSGAAADMKWGLGAELYEPDPADDPKPPTVTDLKAQRQQVVDAQLRVDILAWLKEHPLSTAKDLIDHASGGQRQAFLRVIAELRREGAVNFNGDVYTLPAEAPTPFQAFGARIAPR